MPLQVILRLHETPPALTPAGSRGCGHGAGGTGGGLSGADKRAAPPCQAIRQWQQQQQLAAAAAAVLLLKP